VRGTLWELDPEGGYLRFRCRVGHAYTADTLIRDQEDATDRALWSAVRALEESAAVSRRLAKTSEAFQEHYRSGRASARGTPRSSADC
jgi:two-component system chemotaxis response regulator CheB